MHEPSDKVIKKVVRKNWKLGTGYIDRNITLLVTPRVKVLINKFKKELNRILIEMCL
jgi:hypothetical protein